MKIEDGMLDLETVGTKPGCPVLSIGCVLYNRDRLGAEFYIEIARESAWRRALGLALKEDPGTVKWWQDKPQDAKRTFDNFMSGGGVPLRLALIQFSAWWKINGGVRIWGNGADFDQPILAAAYAHVGMTPPWGPFNGRCYRTIKNQAYGPKLQRRGTHHNALDDAVSQALHHQEMMKANRSMRLA